MNIIDDFAAPPVVRLAAEQTARSTVTRLHETRATTSDYRHEMAADEHQRLLETLSQIEGKFLLSRYQSKLYETWTDRCGWSRAEKEIDNKASGSEHKPKKTEILLANFPLVEMQR